MAADVGEIMPPTEIRWAQPKPPPHPSISKSRDFRLHLASVPASTVLSARRAEAAQGPYSPDAPHSARLPGAPGAGGGAANRIRSADARWGEPARQERADAASCDTFLSVLVENGAGVLEPAVLARLETEASTSRRLVEVVRSLRTIAARLQDDDSEAPSLKTSPEALDIAQMAAQVAYLDKKVARLREKVKKKAREASEAPALPPRPADVTSASAEELAAELAALRAVHAQREEAAQRGPGEAVEPSPRGRVRRDSQPKAGSTAAAAAADKEAVAALKRQWANLQTQLRDIAAEKAAADASAERARALAEQVEVRLQEMVRAREAERAKLEADRELLARRVEERAAGIAQAEKSLGTAVDEEEGKHTRLLEAAKEKLQQLERALTEERRRAQATPELPACATPLPDEAPSQEAAPQEATPARLSKVGSEAVDSRPRTALAPSDPATATASRPPTSTEEEIEEARQAAELEAKAVSAELDRRKAEAAEQTHRLEEQLAEMKAAGAAAELARRRELAAEADRRAQELAAAAEAAGERAAARAQSGAESETVIMTRAELQRSKEQLAREAADARAAAEASIRALEARAQFLQDEASHKQEAQAFSNRRRRDLRGRFMLALRPPRYRRMELLHYLSLAAGIPCDSFRVSQESELSEGFSCDSLPEVEGKLVADSDAETLKQFVRPLPELGGRAPEGATAAEASGQGDCALPEPEEGALLRVAIDVPVQTLDPGRTGRSHVIYRLVDSVRTGGSVLEDLAVVGACALRGSDTFHSGSWRQEQAKLFARAVHQVSGRCLVITAYGMAYPLAVKLLAVDNQSGSEYTLCLDDVDVAALTRGRGLDEEELRDLPPTLLSALVQTLKVLPGPDGQPALVAAEAVEAPATVLNAAPEAATAPEKSAEAVQELQGATAVRGPALVAKLRAAFATEQPTSRLLFEDAVLLDVHLLMLSVFLNDATGAMQLKLQEPGTCQLLEISLPGRSKARQLRAFAQVHEFRSVTALVSIEDVAFPPAVVVRVARADPTQPPSWRDPLQQVFWLSREDADDGGLASRGSTDADRGRVVSMVPSQHRARLLDFTGADPLPPQQGESGPAGTALAGAAEAEYGCEANRAGAMLRDPGVPRQMQDAKAALVTAQLVAASKQGRMLLETEQELLTPSDESVTCQFTVRENADPFLHFVITAHELSGEREWSLVVNSLDVFRALEVRLAAEVRDGVARRSLAKQLVQNCELVHDGHGGLELRLVPVEGQALPALGDAPAAEPRRPAASRAPQLPGGLAPQLLQQEQAVQYMAEDHYCLLRATRTMGAGGAAVDIHIFDEPEAPEGAFHVNNFLVIGKDLSREVFYSLRLNDKLLAQPLAQGERDLLEPENRQRLLERIVCSLEVTVAAAGAGAGGERLVVHPHRTADVGPFRLDSTGTLRPVSELEPAGAVLAIADGSSGPSSTAPLLALPAPADAADAALVRLPAAVHVGAFVPEAGAESDGRELAAHSATLGGADVNLQLKVDATGRAHVLTVRHAAAGADEVLAVQIPAEGEPTRVYMECRTLGGVPVILAIAQQAVPHEVQAIVFDPRSQDEVLLTAASDQMMPIVERSTRDRLGEAAVMLMQFGALHRPGEFRKVPVGREIFPTDQTKRALQMHTPVVTANLGQSMQSMPPEMANARELLFSCTRFVVAPERGRALLEEGCDKAPSDLPLLRISLSKKSYCQDFTLSIEMAGGGGTGPLDVPHMVHLRDKLTMRPLGFFAEVCHVGPLRLLVVVLDDYAPRALRLAVVEPTSGWSFQLAIVDEASLPAAAASSGRPGERGLLAPLDLGTCLPRREMLRLFQRRLSAQRDLAAGPVSALPESASPLPRSPPPAPLGVQQEAGRIEAPVRQFHVLQRVTRFVDDDSDEVVLITVSFEVSDEGPLVLRATLSQPGSTKESQLLLVNPGLDRVLTASGLPSCEELRGESAVALLTANPTKGKVADLVLKAVEVSPSLDMSFSLDKLAGEIGKQDLPHAPAPDASHATAAAPPPALECSEDALLGRWERERATATVDSSGPGAGPLMRVEVFDGSDCREALFNSTNLRLRVTDLASGVSVTKDVHEADLEPWLEEAGAGHLLSASREADLVEAILKHASLLEGPVPGIRFESISEEMKCTGQFATGLLESAVLRHS